MWPLHVLSGLGMIGQRHGIHAACMNVSATQPQPPVYKQMLLATRCSECADGELDCPMQHGKSMCAAAQAVRSDGVQRQ